MWIVVKLPYGPGIFDGSGKKISFLIPDVDYIVTWMSKTVQVSGFPSSTTAEAVQLFLESHTGAGTVEALKIREPRAGGARRYAVVQFTTTRAAEQIISLANRRLWYGSSYLKARPMDRDIIPQPRSFLHTMGSVTLHFGCQTSKEKFSVVWRENNVSVNFGLRMRKLHFFLSHDQVEYKLDLLFENIWQIELHRPRGQTVKYLLIQLYGAPRIYEREAPSSFNVFEDPVLNYFRDVPDEQWVRTTDFTPSCCIGHSSSLCLELPNHVQLPNFKEYFFYYKENEGTFVLESGRTFSRNPDLVPIGCLAGSMLNDTFYRLVDPNRMPVNCIEYALEKLHHLKECCYEPSKWFYEQYQKYLTSSKPPRSPVLSLDAGLVYVHRVQITPCKVFFSGPEVNVSNRVLRQYSEDIDNFLRVSFVDEELEKIHSTDVSPRTSSRNEHRRTAIYNRILSTLQNGIVIGDKKFEFLAFSSSQLRENSCWILGQSFGSSTETLSVSRHEIENIPDIEVLRGGTTYLFSDGIGKISAEFARRVAIKCGCRGFTPSAFQIRYAGYKGVVAVDPTSSKKLSLRKSMFKYESENTKLDVLAHSKYQPCFLNRQLITLLSTLGVPDHNFERKQREAVDQLDAILTDPLRAQEALELMSPGENTNILKEMLLCGYQPDAEPFLSMMLQTFRALKLLELRTKTRIFIPNGRSMMGCLDETRTLEYGQVFVQFSGSGYRHLYDSSVMFSDRGQGQSYLIKGSVVVAKNPCLHPGDVRILEAVDVPALHHMVDCVVFPQKGPRPHPNECSGSDLDGDIYFVCWDPELIPPRQISPMDYTPEPTLQLDRDVTIELQRKNNEVEEYFTNYIVNDSLGIIANAHTAFADKESLKAMSEPCIELARKFSIAVDFPKTGVPAEIPSHLRVKSIS
ncbi:RNA-dependent RNA polymerase [Salix koriyanagi]|uniref:RNA-dependent RNA polymerase n=1 Tax=Salix koriyanagi TaxID=2511006 RepID=A0A9Q0WNG0_9ROSI|nr:RNA-dependent RNA polymerase [Salix koriyanagi]